MAEYRPTKKVEEQLRLLLRANVSVPRICVLLETGESVLRRHYPQAFAEIIRRDGVKPHEPSDETRARVRALAAIGASHENIAFSLGIGLHILTAYYRDDLRHGELDANSKVAAKLLSMALGPNDSKNTFLAAKWWTTARMNWTDKIRNEMTGPDGGPLQTEHKVVVILPDNGRSADINLEAPDAEIADDHLLPAPFDPWAPDDELNQG